jgi:Avidin family
VSLSRRFVFARRSYRQRIRPEPALSYWKNQRGDEMKIYSMAADGSFKGVYIPHGTGWRRCQNMPYDLWGRAVGDHVRFWVVFKTWTTDCKSAVVWRGRVVGTTIWTRGLLTVHNDNGTVSRIRGTDVFQQQP